MVRRMSDDELKRLVLSLIVEVKGLRLDVRALRQSLEERGVVLDFLEEVHKIDIPADIEELLRPGSSSRPRKP